ncbi:MAG: ABC transporter substrate-binding protein, partial [Synechococcus sp. Baikal-G1]
MGLALAVALVGGCTAPPQAQKPAQRQIEFWTLDLSPKFNGYLQAVIA